MQALVYDQASNSFRGECKDLLAVSGNYSYNLLEDYEIADKLVPHLPELVFLGQEGQLVLPWLSRTPPDTDYFIVELLKRKDGRAR